jgi:hypothetical protein
MSYDDNNRPNDSRDRGPYTPPTDDDLPFNAAAASTRVADRRPRPAPSP